MSQLFESRSGKTLRTESTRQKARNRRGAAIIEFAICLPFLMFIVVASMECTNYIFLRQALVQSAYEGTKLAINPQSSQSTATRRIQEVLKGRNIQNASIRYRPKNTDKAKRGKEVTVTVVAPSSDNLLFNLPGFSNRDVTVTATMIRE